MKMKRSSIYINSNSKVKYGLFFIISLMYLSIPQYTYAHRFNIPVAKLKKVPAKLFDIQRMLKYIEKDELMDMLRLFVKSSRPSRLVGTTGHKQAEEFLLKTLNDMDPDKKHLKYVDSFNPDVDFAKKMYWDDFNKEIKTAFKPSDPTFIKWMEFTKSMTSFLESKRGVKGKNIVWEKRGILRPKDILVIGAHYDTLVTNAKTMKIEDSVPMPGANDNASGVTIALALVQLLSKLDLPITIRVVFFDWGELGFLGSKAFASKYRQEFKDKNFLGLINLDMLGHDSKFLDSTKKFGNMKAYIRRPGNTGFMDDNRLVKRLVEIGDRISPSIDFKIDANHFKNSDNISFWREDLSAATFTGDWENDFDKDRYHSSSDLVETLNINTFYRSYQFIGGAVMAMAFDITR